MPAALAAALGKDVLHASGFLDHREHLRRADAVVVVGSGQSGAEIFLELLREQPVAGYRLDWLTRSAGFFPMEYSKLGLEHFTPDYTRYFHALPPSTRQRLLPTQDLLYKGIDAGTIGAVYGLLYERSVGGAAPPVRLLPHTAVRAIGRAGGRWRLDCHQWEQEVRFSLEADRVVLATGYRADPPACIAELRPRIRWDEAGRYRVGLDYRVQTDAGVTGSLFVQNAELHTHGVGAPDLGLGAHRAATIVNALAGREVYRLPARTAFTDFAAFTDFTDQGAVASTTPRSRASWTATPGSPRTRGGSASTTATTSVTRRSGPCPSGRCGWPRARRGRPTQAVDGLDHDRLLDAEIDGEVRAAFAARLRARARAGGTGAYAWFPVHPWQWANVVLPLFAAELAAGDLVVLGEAGDDYLPQQSVRTLSNRTSPHRHHLKLPLSVLNTLVWRGLPTERALAAPKVTAHLEGIRDADPFLRDQCRLVLLGEVASVAVPHRVYEALPGAPYQFRELLGCIWRAPLERFLEPGERALALAALLHVDAHGTPVVAAMVERSGLGAEAWLERFLDAVLPPLLHYLYRYGTVFSPHGENAVLVHCDGVPARLALKDFVDDVNLSDQPLPELERVPADVRQVLLSAPPEWLCQFLWAGLLIGHFRYLADLMEDALGLPERRFWGLVRAQVLAYQARFPELAERFALFDLLRPRFAKICLNRNRLLLDGYADRPERPHAATHGTVRNALAETGYGLAGPESCR